MLYQYCKKTDNLTPVHKVCMCSWEPNHQCQEFYLHIPHLVISVAQDCLILDGGILVLIPCVGSQYYLY